MSNEKTWLIRTRAKQILGPATKQRIVELVQKGSLSDEDEVSSGNGYWFWLKEKDLVEKYLFGDIPQEFNPIAEAPDILTVQSETEVTASFSRIPLESLGIKQAGPDMDLLAQHGVAEVESSAPPEIQQDDDEDDLDDGKQNLPSDDDLAFPDMGGSAMAKPVAQPKEVKPAPPTPPPPEPIENVQPPAPQAVEEQVVCEDGSDGILPSSEDLEYPDMDFAENFVEEETVLPEGDDLAFPDMGESEEVADLKTDPSMAAAFEVDESELAQEETDIGDILEDDIEEEVDPPQHKDPPKEPARKQTRKKSKKKSRKRKVIHQPERNDRYLFILAFVIGIVIVGVLYYYKKVLNKPLPYIGMVQSVQAQTIDSLSKKKTL